MVGVHNPGSLAMRNFSMLLLFAAGLMIPVPAKAQTWTWKFRDTVMDPFSMEILSAGISVKAINQSMRGILDVTCDKEAGLRVYAGFFDRFGNPLGDADTYAKAGTPVKDVDIRWVMHGGEIKDFRALGTPAFYFVHFPESVELARALVNMEGLTTSNGHDKSMTFMNLRGGRRIENILETCGH